MTIEGEGSARGCEGSRGVSPSRSSSSWTQPPRPVRLPHRARRSQMVSCNGSPSVVSDDFASRIGRPLPALPQPSFRQGCPRGSDRHNVGKRVREVATLGGPRGKGGRREVGCKCACRGSKFGSVGRGDPRLESQEHEFVQSPPRINARKVGPTHRGPAPTQGPQPTGSRYDLQSRFPQSHVLPALFLPHPRSS